MAQVEDSPDEALSVGEFQPNKTGLVGILYRGSQKQDNHRTAYHDQSSELFNMNLVVFATCIIKE